MNEKREQEEVFAAGSAIDSSLKQLAERRTDIFGYGTEEKQIGQKVGSGVVILIYVLMLRMVDFPAVSLCCSGDGRKHCYFSYYLSIRCIMQV